MLPARKFRRHLRMLGPKETTRSTHNQHLTQPKTTRSHSRGQRRKPLQFRTKSQPPERGAFVANAAANGSAGNESCCINASSFDNAGPAGNSRMMLHGAGSGSTAKPSVRRGSILASTDITNPYRTPVSPRYHCASPVGAAGEPPAICTSCPVPGGIYTALATPLSGSALTTDTGRAPAFIGNECPLNTAVRARLSSRDWAHDRHVTGAPTGSTNRNGLLG